jgi:hypothetical protein
MPRVDGRGAFKPRPRRGLRGFMARGKSRQAAAARSDGFPGSAGAAQPPSPAAADAEEDNEDEDAIPELVHHEEPPPPPPLSFDEWCRATRASLPTADPDPAPQSSVAWRPGLHAEVTAEELQREARTSRAAGWRSLQLLRASMLWKGDYSPLLIQESFEAPELRSEVVGMLAAQKSSYRERLEAPQAERLLRRYEEKTERIIRDTVAVARRRRNQLDIPFSVMARSISYFNQRVPQRVWREQQRSLRIIGREATLNMLHFMMEVEPIHHQPTRGSIPSVRV